MAEQCVPSQYRSECPYGAQWKTRPHSGKAAFSLTLFRYQHSYTVRKGTLFLDCCCELSQRAQNNYMRGKRKRNLQRWLTMKDVGTTSFTNFRRRRLYSKWLCFGHKEVNALPWWRSAAHFDGLRFQSRRRRRQHYSASEKSASEKKRKVVPFRFLFSFPHLKIKA